MLILMITMDMLLRSDNNMNRRDAENNMVNLFSTEKYKKWLINCFALFSADASFFVVFFPSRSLNMLISIY